MDDKTPMEQIEDSRELILSDLLPVAQMKYEKSNMLIYGRYNMSKMAQKTLAYALSTLRGRRFTEKDKQMGISVTFTSSEISHILINPNAAKRGSLSKELKKIASNLHGKTVFVMDDNEEDGNFISFTFIKTCEYMNDSFKITFHENMSPYLVNLEKSGNFTVLDVNHIKNMRSGYTIRIYEICESFAFLARKHNGICVKKFDLIEFKLMIGLIDSEEPDIQAITSRYKNDYFTIGKKIEELYERYLSEIESINEKIAQVSHLPWTDEQKADYIDAQKNSRKAWQDKITQIHKYRSATEFRRRVLEVAKKELNEMMDRGEVDVCFDFQMLTKNQSIYGFQMAILTREGRDIYRKQQRENRQYTLYDYAQSRSAGFCSTARKQEAVKEDQAPKGVKDKKYCKKEELVDTLDKIDGFLKHGPHKIELSLKDVYKLAGMVDSDIFIEKYKQMENAGEIRNPMGWMIAAINGDFQSQSQGAKTGSANQFNQFQQNTYDFTELEKELLANQSD